MICATEKSDDRAGFFFAASASFFQSMSVCAND
jgi:hypothetical protein